MEIHFDQILMQALNFGILLFVLTKFLYKPILKILEQRAEKIDLGLKTAELNLQEKGKIETLRKQQLQVAEMESAKIIEAAKAKAEKVAKELLEKAQADTAETIKKEEAAFKARMQQQEEELIGKTAELVLNVSRRLIKDTLSPTHQEEILAAQLKELKNIKLSN